MSTYLAQSQDIIEIGRLLADRRLVAGSDGNLSIRIDAARILITPSGQPLGELTHDDLLILDPQGEVLEGWRPPSSETAMHLHVYRHRPETRAVVHAHPPFATAFAAAGVELEWDVLPEVALFVGRIPLTDYAAPGTAEVPQALEKFLGDHHALLLRNHGLLTLGGNIDEAYRRLDVVEHAARILYYSRQLGGPQKIPAEDLERLNALRQQIERRQPASEEK